MDEYIDILSSEGKPIGEVRLKSEAHKKGLWHASAQIWIVDSNKNVLLQKRAKTKDSYPDLWDISVAGHLSANDTPILAAQREVKEEIGIDLAVEQFHFLKRIKRSKIPQKGFLDNEFNYLFVVNCDISIEALKLQKEEVAQVKLVPLKKFRKQLKETPELFVPHGKKYYEYIINELLEL